MEQAQKKAVSVKKTAPTWSLADARLKGSRSTNVIPSP